MILILAPGIGACVCHLGVGAPVSIQLDSILRLKIFRVCHI